MNFDPITITLAEIQATQDGKLAAFVAERDGLVKYGDPTYTGHFEGYCHEAIDTLEVLAEHGLFLQPIR